MVLCGLGTDGNGRGACWRDQCEQKPGGHSRSGRSSSACLPITQGSEYFCLGNLMQLMISSVFSFQTACFGTMGLCELTRHN